MMGLVFCFLTNSLFFLLCSGTWYLVSSLVRVLIIREMKFLSLDFTTVFALTCLLSLVVSDISAGRVIEDKAWSRSELGNSEDARVESLIDASEYVEEVLEVSSSSEAQKVQLDRARWYLLLAKIS